MSQSKCLFVDDDATVLLSIQRMMRSSHSIEVSTHADEALQWLREGRVYDVIVSDMRMPGIDGVQFLVESRKLLPDAVRLMLTGEADLPAASRAINDGAVYRLLLKPVTKDALSGALNAAITYGNVARAERDLLSRTLTGAVDALTELISLLNPAVFGRVQRYRRIAALLGTDLGLRDLWRLEVAAMLSQFSAVMLPPELALRSVEGVPLRDDEKQLVAAATAQSLRILGRIPRLESVIELMQTESETSTEAWVLRVSRHLEGSLAQGLDVSKAIELARVRLGAEAKTVIESAFRLRHLLTETGTQKSLKIESLQVGMVLDDDVRTSAGALLIARGHAVTDLVLARLRNFAGTVGVREPLLVRLAA